MKRRTFKEAVSARTDMALGRVHNQDVVLGVELKAATAEPPRDASGTPSVFGGVN